jgi:UDP-2,3-diacylglucosamine hydrolase
MRKVFISDAHLRNEKDENYGILSDFLKGLAGNTETLFILGDLFEFWIGYPQVPFRHYLPILEHLRLLREAGIEIVYFEGNHDFHMGTFFEQTLNARIYSGPAVIDLDGKKVYLCHGDQVNDGDYGYRILRFCLHNRLTRWLIPFIPPFVASHIADRMGRASRKNHAGRNAKWDFPSIIRGFANKRFMEGCDVVVVGHFHLPFLEETGSGCSKALISLGDWISHFTYGEWENGRLSLKYFKP